MSADSGTIRLDKYLWQARFFRTRSLSTAVVAAGKVRVNGHRTSKPAQIVRVGDGLTFPQGSAIRVVRVAALPLRRGSATEAQSLFIEVQADGPVPLDPADGLE